MRPGLILDHGGPTLAELFPDLTANTNIDIGATVKPLRVALVDSQAIVREGLRLLIEHDGDLDVVAQWSTLEEIEGHPTEPQVVVTDLALPGCSGGAVVTRIRDRVAAAVVVLSTARHPTNVDEALAAGALGYVLRTGTPDELLRSIRTAARGGTYLQASLRGEMAGPRGTDPLTSKEEAVLRLIALGHTHREIAELLSVSVRTVENHHGRVVRKLGGNSRSELVRRANELGLIELRAWPTKSPFRDRQ